MDLSIRLSRSVLDAIAAHALRERPRECCGLLVGTSDEVAEAVAARNVAADPVRRYEIAPEDHIAVLKHCRERVEESGVPASIVGAYHSHPRSAPEPSPTDLDQAFEDFLYVIAGVPAAGEVEYGVEIRGYRLRAGRLEPVELLVS